jgi:RimJ/RimL family protein N-acetyltransferase
MATRYYDGERIYFRPVEMSDEAMLRGWVGDPANWSTLGRFLPVNELREREWIEKLYKDDRDIALGIAVREGDRLIGVAGLHAIHPVNRAAIYGILIGDREFQGQGYGTEATRLMVKYAFEELNLNRIELAVFADHERAVKCYQRAGFVIEGRARQAWFRNGRWHDDLRMAILREEYAAGKGGD